MSFVGIDCSRGMRWYESIRPRAQSPEYKQDGDEPPALNNDFVGNRTAVPDSQTTKTKKSKRDYKKINGVGKKCLAIGIENQVHSPNGRIVASHCFLRDDTVQID